MGLQKHINYQYNALKEEIIGIIHLSLSITNKNHYLFNEFKRRQNLSDNDFIFKFFFLNLNHSMIKTNVVVPFF